MGHSRTRRNGDLRDIDYLEFDLEQALDKVSKIKDECDIFEVEELEVSLEHALRNVRRHLAAPAPVMSTGVDIFAVTGDPSEDYTAVDAIKMIDYLRENYGTEMALHLAPSYLGALTHVSLDPIVQRYFSAIKERLKGGGVNSDDRRDMIAALEFLLYMRNLSAPRSWTLEYPEAGSQITPMHFNEVSDLPSGRISEVLLPRVPQVRQLRGLVVVEPPRRR